MPSDLTVKKRAQDLDITPDQFQYRFPELTRNMAREQLLVLVAHLEKNTLSSGDQLILDGARSDTMFFVWRGRLTVALSMDQQDLIVGTMKPGDWVGEIALMDPGPACATVVAAENSVVFALTTDAFSRLENHHPVIASLILQVLCKELASRLRASNNLLLDVLSQAGRENLVSMQKQRWIQQLGGHVTGAGE